METKLASRELTEIAREEFRGGAIDIKNMDDVEDWGAKIKEIRDKLHQRKEVVNE